VQQNGPLGWRYPSQLGQPEELYSATLDKISALLQVDYQENADETVLLVRAQKINFLNATLD